MYCEKKLVAQCVCVKTSVILVQNTLLRSTSALLKVLSKVFFSSYVGRNFAVINLLFSVFSYKSFIKGFQKFVLS